MRKTRLIALIVVVAAALWGLWGLWRLAKSPETQVLGRLVPRVETSEKVVALTFDDGPVPDVLDDVLETLRVLDVHATFFVTGRELAEAPGAGRRLVQAGHELGNHSYSHQRMIVTTPWFVSGEVERTDRLIRAAGHSGEIFFRPPFGKKLFVLPWYLWQTRRTSVSWDVDADSTAGKDVAAATIASRAVERTRSGSIILFHIWYPGRSTSRAAVPLVVRTLRDRGFRFVTVGQLVSRE